MLAAIFTAIGSMLPNFLLSGFKSYLDATTTVAVEGEKTTRQVTTAAIGGLVSIRQAQAAVVQTGMAHKAFWIPWLMAAIPAAGWYAWGMVDSTWPGHFPHVAALPDQLLAFTQDIWGNLFLSGGVALGSTAVAGSIGAIAKSLIERART